MLTPLTPSSAVGEHYNNVAATTFSREHRRGLKTYPVREFNNLLKRTLLYKIAPFLPPRPRILDLCCGRGGDIFKYMDIQPSYVCFADISASSIAEAKRRLATGPIPVNYASSFHVIDCMSDEPILETEDEPFDVVVCHFAMHYAFSDERRASAFFNNVRALLRAGGYFIATYPNYDSLRALCSPRHDRWRTYTSDVMSIVIPREFDDGASTQAGNEYFFSLEGAVSSCAEYVVAPTLLQEHLARAHIGLVSSHSFLDAANVYQILAKLPADVEMQKIIGLYTCTIGVATVPHSSTSSHLRLPSESVATIDYCVRLREQCQARGLPSPTYVETPTSNWREWVSHVSVCWSDGATYTQQSSPSLSKRRAQREAASKMLENVLEMSSLSSVPLPFEYDSVVHVDMMTLADAFVADFPLTLFCFYATPNSPSPSIDGRARNVKLCRVASASAGAMESLIVIRVAQLSATRPEVTQTILTRAFLSTSPLVHAALLLPNVALANSHDDLCRILTAAASTMAPE